MSLLSLVLSIQAILFILDTNRKIILITLSIIIQYFKPYFGYIVLQIDDS